MDAKDAVGIFNGPIKFVEDIAGFLVRPLMGVWGIVIWLVDTWCELIVTVLSIFGWLAAIAALFLMSTGAWLFGGIALVAALLFFACSDFFRLVEFWLSGKGYTTAPAKFVGDIVGTVIGFVLFYGLLSGIYLFLFPANWLLAAIIVFASKSVLSSIARFIRHFLAMLKDQVGGKPAAPAPAQKA